MPSVMAARWVGQNSGPIFHRLWTTKVHGIKFACVGVSVVCNAIFRLTISCCVPEIVAIKSQSCAKLCRNLMFGPPNFGGRATQISDRILQIWVTVEHVAKFGDDRPSNLGD